MNREILFRGFHECEDSKTVIKVDGVEKRGEWLYGYYCAKGYDCADFDCIEPKTADSDYGSWEIIPSTVGQFTGLVDKNGNRIFEGDVVEFDRKIRAQKMLRVRGNVFFEEEICAFSVSDDFIFNSNAGFLCDCENIEVISNIFEAYEMAICSVLRIVEHTSTADVQEVVHGKWLNFIGDFSTAECSKCGEIYEVAPDEKSNEDFFKAFNECYKFCPNCGCRMDGENNEPTA